MSISTNHCLLSSFSYRSPPKKKKKKKKKDHTSILIIFQDLNSMLLEMKKLCNHQNTFLKALYNVCYR